MNILFIAGFIAALIFSIKGKKLLWKRFLLFIIPLTAIFFKTQTIKIISRISEILFNILSPKAVLMIIALLFAIILSYRNKKLKWKRFLLISIPLIVILFKTNSIKIVDIFAKKLFSTINPSLILFIIILIASFIFTFKNKKLDWKLFLAVTLLFSSILFYKTILPYITKTLLFVFILIIVLIASYKKKKWDYFKLIAYSLVMAFIFYFNIVNDYVKNNLPFSLLGILFILFMITLIINALVKRK